MDVKAEKIKPYDGDMREKGQQVRDMFDNIAPAYDFMNRAMTLGIDNIWREKAVKMVKAHAKTADPTYKILDVATGTADLAIMLTKAIPAARVTGIDLSKEMMEIGAKKVAEAGESEFVDFVVGDCMALPFLDETFDCVTAAFGVRNFQHLADGYREMLRVLRPGGMLCIIELSTPKSPIVKPLYNLYTKHIIPLVGRLVSKDTSAYAYLPASIQAVPKREEMTEIISSVGFKEAKYHSLTFGVCTIYTAIK